MDDETLKEYYLRRGEIKERFLPKMYMRKLEISDYTDKDLMELFSLYDEIWFGWSIASMIEKNGFNIFFDFIDDDDIEDISFCSEKDKDIYIHINRKKIPETSIKFDCYHDKFDCFMAIMEYEIIHIIMRLYGYFVEYDSFHDKFSRNGKLFRCLLLNIFGREYRSIDDVESKKLDLQNITFIKYFENSCYMDSLLTILLFNKDSFWRDEIFLSTIENEINYRDCSSSVLSENIKNVYTQIIDKKKNITCKNIRKNLKKCLRLKKRGSYIFFNVAAVYSTFCELFPKLKLSVPKKLGKYEKEEGIYKFTKIRNETLPILQVTDFVQREKVVRGDIVPVIDWKNYNYPILVLSNEGQIKNPGFLGEENIKFQLTGQKSKINKIRKLDYEILENKYELIGVITLLGISPGKEGGTHYISYVKGNDNEFYFYDGMKGIKKIGKLPSIGVWESGNGRMPVMFFYSKND